MTTLSSILKPSNGIDFLLVPSSHHSQLNRIYKHLKGRKADVTITKTRTRSLLKICQ